MPEKSTLLTGLPLPCPQRPKLAIGHMTDLFTLDGGLPPPDLRNEDGSMKPLPPAPPTPPVQAAVMLEQNQRRGGVNAALHGGTVGKYLAKDLRIAAYEGVGGVHVSGGSYQVEGATISVNAGDGDAPPATGVAVTDHGRLVLKDSEVYVSGQSAGATTADGHSELRVEHCILISQGSPYGPDASEARAARRSPPAPLELGGNCRTHITLDHSSSYFTDSTIITDGWAALSTDSSNGYVYLQADRCKVRATKGGYGVYADKFCHVALRDCDIDVDRHGLIIDGEADAVFQGGQIACGGYFAMIHCSGGPPTQVGEVTAKNCRISAALELFTIRSESAWIDLEGCQVESESGVLLHSIVNPDPMAPPTNGRAVFGIRAVFRDMELRGDILHEDPDREMTVTLSGTRLTGGIQNAGLCLEPDSVWFADKDSRVTLQNCQAHLGQFDAAASVVIECTAENEGEFPLPSGGVLRVRAPGKT